MYYHIVVFKLTKNDNTTVNTVTDELLRLKNLPYISEFQIATEYVFHNTSQGDIAIFSIFESKEKYHAYMTDALHEEVKLKTNPFIMQKQCIDFEL